MVDLHEGEDVAGAERAVCNSLFDRLGLHLDDICVLAQIRLSVVIEVPQAAALLTVPTAGGCRYARLLHRESGSSHAVGNVQLRLSRQPEGRLTRFVVVIVPILSGSDVVHQPLVKADAGSAELLPPG